MPPPSRSGAAFGADNGHAGRFAVQFLLRQQNTAGIGKPAPGNLRRANPAQGVFSQKPKLSFAGVMERQIRQPRPGYIFIILRLRRNPAPRISRRG